MIKKQAFNLGDQVSMLNEAISGEIVNMDKDHIVIMTKDGFEYTCSMNEIVRNAELPDFLFEGIEKGIKNKKSPYLNSTKKVKNKEKSKVLEIDLHIHELVDTEKGMRNIDILNLQLQTVKKQMEFAKQNKIQRVIFIHGIGAGVLKKELHHLLKKYKVDFFEASYSNYGQGATEVYVYQN